MFTEWVLHSILLYATFPLPLNFPQRYDFKGLTPINYMDKDLSSIFGLNSHFGAVLGRIREHFSTGFAHVRSTALFIKEYWATPSRICLKTALRLCRSFAHQRPLSHWASCASVLGVTVECDEKLALYSRRDVGHPSGQP